jgi:tetratricopeptide (TPR) repeat protein
MRIEILLRRASLALDVSDLSSAVDAATAAEALVEAGGEPQNRVQRATAILTRARAYFLLNDTEACRVALEAGLAFSRAAKAPAREAWALEQQGLLRWSVGDYRGAREKLGLALDLFRSVGDNRAEWSVLNNLGVVATEERDFGRAERLFAEARAIVVRSGLRAAEARLLVNEGDAGYQAGDYTLSRNCARQALEIAADISDRRLQSLAAGNLAETLIDVGDYAAARPIAASAFDLASAIDFGGGKCANRENLARLHLACGQPALAVTEAVAGIAVAESLNLRARLGSLLILQARALTALGRHAEALSAGEAARALASELGSSALAVQSDATRAEALLARQGPGDIALALRLSLPEAEILEHSDASGAPLEYPLWTNLTMIRAMIAAGDARAPAAARTTVDALKARAARISDLAMRRGFVDDVPEHAAIQRLFAELSAKSA